MRGARSGLAGGALLSVLFALLAAAGCDGPTGPRDGTRLGILSFRGDTAVVSVPASVAAGDSFAVEIRTQGGGCTTKGPTRVDPVEAGVRIRPYDVTPERDDLVCPAILRTFLHRVELAFGEPGQRTVAVWGRKPGDEDEVVEVTRAVTVEQE